MTIESALYSYLSTKTTVTDEVSTRIYPQTAPNGTAYPFITFSVISETNDHSMTGATGLANPIIQVDIWSATIASRVSGSEAIRNALDGFTGDMGTENLNIRSCFLSNRSNFEESDTEGKGQPTYRSSMDFSIWHVESLPTL